MKRLLVVMFALLVGLTIVPASSRADLAPIPPNDRRQELPPQDQGGGQGSDTSSTDGDVSNGRSPGCSNAVVSRMARSNDGNLALVYGGVILLSLGATAGVVLLSRKQSQ